MAINRYRLRHQANAGNLTAKQVQKLLETPDQLLAIILIGNTLANILASALATVLAMQWFGSIGVAVMTGILTLMVLIFSETLPKTIAALYPHRIAFLTVWPLSVLLYLLRPIVWLMNLVVNNLLRLLRIRVTKQGIDRLNQEELRTLVYESSGMLPARHRDMLLSLIDLEKTTVEDVMVPSYEMMAINMEDEWDNILSLLASYQHQYLPIYRTNIQKMVAVLDVQKIVSLLLNNTLDKETLLARALPCHFVSESSSLHTQLLEFQQQKRHYGLVVDEYGVICGFITLTDILEEIVGEYIVDVDTVSMDIHRQTDGSFLVEGAVPLRELNRDMKWSFPLNGPKTLSGLIIDYLEFIPQSNICLQLAGYRLEIKQIKNNRVKTVKITPVAPLP